MMNYMKRFAGLVCAVAAIAFFASCSKDKESGTLSFDSPAVFLSAGQTVKVGFKAVNLQNLSVTNKPTGWAEPTIDVTAQTLTITAPATFDDDEVKTGSLVLVGTPKGGSSVSATLFVGVVESEDLSGKPANSYIVSKPDHNYLISAMHRGDIMAVLPASVDVVWQSKSGLIQYTELREDGMVSFYVGADSDDETKIKEGNAVIGAYDTGGTLIWSWHIWAVDYDPEASAVDFNGLKMMDRNLGALANDNSTVEKILASYGLYYQWGRKDPFIGPNAYNFASGTSASMYNGGGSRVYMTETDANTETGTPDYATHNPLVFIKGVEASGYDWSWDHSAALWSADAKTVNDPCPYSWRVAPAAAFEGLTPDAGSMAWENTKYSVNLGKDAVSSLFMGAGRRVYSDGKFQNFYFTGYEPLGTRANGDGQPWIGLYWTAGASGNLASALYFRYGSSGKVKPEHALRRANALPVRCVKDRK